MLKKLLMIVAMSALTASAFAAFPSEQVEKSISLKNGSTVYILKGGKMAMEDKNGRAVRMKEGEVMETKDGKKIMMHGDEVMRLNSILHPTSD
ncbi:MAG: periplasmic Cu(I)/Cu(II)-binding protein CopK [Sterolibacterium sp.]